MSLLFPNRGESWHRLRREDFSEVDLVDAPELLDLIGRMMRTDPEARVTVKEVCDHPIVARTRSAMDRKFAEVVAQGTSAFSASPLSGVPESFLEEILGRRRRGDENAMDLSV
jgi:mitosis inhibitor protein kinase SWE1